MDGKDPHIRSQNSAHRRGMVLGLTMAEIMVLILFALLLALAAAMSKKSIIIHERDVRIAQLVSLEQQVGDLIRANSKDATVSDIIQKLERQQKQIAELHAEVERLRPYEAGGKALEDIIRELKRNGDQNISPQQVVEKLRDTAQAMKDNQTLRGQVAQLSKQIKDAGRGNEFPSCWVTPEGKAQSIFELLVTADGIVIKDHNLPDRVADRAALPLSNVRYKTELSRQDFLGDLNPLYQWSVSHQCRFYVIRFASVTSTQFDLVNAMDAYFYPDSRIQYRPNGL